MADEENSVGRPPLFKSKKELQSKVDEYFDNPPTRTFHVNGQEFQVPVITISGLAYRLGFESRQSIYDYEKRGEFSYIIKRARLRVEQGYEENLNFNNATGSIFALKNMGWKDKTETELTNPDGSMRPVSGVTIEVIDATKD